MSSNDSVVDYVAQDRMILHKFCGKYFLLKAENNFEIFETENLVGKTENPLTGAPFLQRELDLINFYFECYKYTQKLEISEEILNKFFLWYSQTRRLKTVRYLLRDSLETSEAYSLVNYFLTATDFQSHFRNFDPQDSGKQAYERDLAQKALLSENVRGKWLLRHSSRNRPSSKEKQDKITTEGRRYYALTYMDHNRKIRHVLITFVVGQGWSIFDVWYTNFLDALENSLEKLGLLFYKHVDGYVDVKPLTPFD